MDLDWQRILKEGSRDTLLSIQERLDHIVLLETALDLALNVGVLHLFVLFDDVFDLLDDSLEGPVSKFSSNTHILLLIGELDLLELLHKLCHIEHGHPSASE